ncbi:MAG: hypothetical protein KAS16_04595 [Thermoplasmata archaeon]|nr:hypothetical protein [Thermoplasmata archaeon]
MGPEDIMPMTDEDRKKAIETFLDEYSITYRDHLGAKDTDERHLPLVYKGFPFVIEAYLHPNHSVTVLLKKSNRSRILVVEGEFEDIRNMIYEKSFDFLQIFPPYTRWTTDEAQRMAIVDAERDLTESRRLELISGIEMHIDDVKKEAENILKLNPWLDEQSKAQAEKMIKARELITELYREMETDETERFARYEKELMDIQAFERVEIEAIASEMEVEVETAVGEMEEQFSEIENQFNEIEGNFEELKDNVNDSIQDLKKDMENIDSLRIRLVEAFSTMENLEAKMDNMDSSDDLVDDIKELRETGRKANNKIKNSEKDIRDLKKSIVVSEEIKDTVFRDSKRIHNLNERTTDLEKQIEKLEAKKSKKTENEVKALQKRLDKMDKDLNKMVEKAVIFELEARKPVYEEVPPPPSTPPKGATVKRTTKKTTTKKTKKSK